MSPGQDSGGGGRHVPDKQRGQSLVVPVDKVGTNVTWERTTHFGGPVFVSHTKDGDMKAGEKLKRQHAI